MLSKLVKRMKRRGITASALCRYTRIHILDMRALLGGVVPTWDQAESIAEVLGTGIDKLWDALRAYEFTDVREASDLLQNGITAEEYDQHSVIAYDGECRVIRPAVGLPGLLVRRKVTVAQLAAHAGLRPATVRNIYHGYSEPTRLQAEAICALLTCTVGDLFLDQPVPVCLVAALNKTGISARRLVPDTGISMTTLARIIDGIYIPTRSVAMQICAALDMPLYEVFTQIRDDGTRGRYVDVDIPTVIPYHQQVRVALDEALAANGEFTDHRMGMLRAIGPVLPTYALISEMVGIGGHTVAACCTGRSVPSPAVAKAVCDVLGCEIGEIWAYVLDGRKYVRIDEL